MKKILATCFIVFLGAAWMLPTVNAQVEPSASEAVSSIDTTTSQTADNSIPSASSETSSSVSVLPEDSSKFLPETTTSTAQTETSAPVEIASIESPVIPNAAMDITPASTLGINYSISVVNDAACTNGIKYILSNVSIAASVSGYGSLTIALPPEYTATYVKPASWNVFTSGNIINFIISNPASNGTVALIQNFLENNLYFTLATEDVFPSALSLLTVNVSQNYVSSRIDDNGIIHYYEFVPSTNITWMNAYNGAKARTFNGLTGYLATITSQTEHDFIYYSIAKSGGWLGASRLRNIGTNTFINDEPTISTNVSSFEKNISIANKWYWVNGPESGTVFFNGATAATGSPAPDQYNNWTNAEPNNTASNESVMQFAFTGSKWNDLPAVPTNYILGYYVEYGGYPNEVRHQEHAGYQAPFPAPVKIQYLTLQNTPLFSEEILLGNILDAYTSPTPPAAPTGYTYIGLNAASAPKNGFFSDTPQSIIHNYALTKYNISFNLNYDSSATPPSQQNITYGAKFGPLPVVARPGFTFDGWCTTADGTGSIVDANTTLESAENIQLYARWTANIYTISFSLNYAGAPAGPASQNVVFDTAYGTLPVVSRGEYTFLGWFLDTSSSSPAVNPATTITTPYNHTLYAKWAEPAPPPAPVPSSSPSSQNRTASSQPANSSSLSASSSNALVSSSSSFTEPQSSSVSSIAKEPTSSLPPTEPKPIPTPREETLQAIEDSGVPTLTLGNASLPLFAPVQLLVWSLFNLLVAIFSTITLCLTVIRLLHNKHAHQNKKSGKTLWLRILAAVCGIALFLFTSNWFGVMVIFDSISILFALLAAIQILTIILSRKDKNQ